MNPPSAKELPPWEKISKDAETLLKRLAYSSVCPEGYPELSFRDDALKLARETYEKNVKDADVLIVDPKMLIQRLAQRAALELRRRILKTPKGAEASLAAAEIPGPSGAKTFRSKYFGQSRAKAPQDVKEVIRNHALKSPEGLVSAIMIKMRWWEGLKPSQVAFRLYRGLAPPNVIQVCHTIQKDYEELSGELKRLL